MCIRVVIHTHAHTTIVNKAVVGVTQFIFKLNNVLRYGGGCCSVVAFSSLTGRGMTTTMMIACKCQLNTMPKGWGKVVYCSMSRK